MVRWDNSDWGDRGHRADRIEMPLTECYQQLFIWIYQSQVSGWTFKGAVICEFILNCLWARSRWDKFAGKTFWSSQFKSCSLFINSHVPTYSCMYCRNNVLARLNLFVIKIENWKIQQMMGFLLRDTKMARTKIL